MTTPLSRQRSQVAIPAQGMIEIRDALTDLLNEFGTEDQGATESNRPILSCVVSANLWPRAGSGVVRIHPFGFVAGCRKRRLNQALSVLNLILGFF